MPHAMDPWWSWISIIVWWCGLETTLGQGPCSLQRLRQGLARDYHRLKSQTNPAPAATVQTRVRSEDGAFAERIEDMCRLRCKQANK